jgi:iron-sulfur cluster assembly protein
MLSLTPTAAEAVETICSQPEIPESAGVRITRGGGEPGGGVELRLAVVEGPAPGDQQVPDARVYVDSEVADFLDDKVLDAEVSGEQVRFGLHD